MERTITIALLDDHPIILAGMKGKLGRIPGHRVVLAATSGEAFLADLAAHAEVDIAIVDLQMPGLDGWAVLERLRKERPMIKCIAFSFSKEPEWVRRAIAEGARAYVLKETRLEVWRSVVQEVMTSGISYSAWVRECLAAPAAPIKPGWIDRAKLPRREREFLEHLLRPGNATNKEIAVLMDVSRSTVDGYLRYFNQHFDIHSREELVRRALLPAPPRLIMATRPDAYPLDRIEWSTVRVSRSNG